MATAAEFARRMSARGAQVETNATRVVRKAALACLQVVTIATPVDTGRARANWQVSVEKPAEGVLDGTDKSGQATIQKGSAKIGNAKGPNLEIHLTNNLPYIRRLDDGWSAQAPSGMTKQGVAAARAVIRKAGLLKG